MLIKVINPNTTSVFTERLRATAMSVAAPGTRIIAANPTTGPAAVESHTEEAMASLGVIAEVEAGERDGVDGYVIACFGDTGVAPAREIAAGPVVGITEAAIFTAALIASAFTIITLPPRTMIHARRVVHEYGLETRCSRIRAIDVAVLDAAHDEAELLQPMIAESRTAIREDGAEAIVLGCAGVAGLVSAMTAALGIPVIDGVGAAVKMVEGLVAQGLRTSKIRSFGFPPGHPSPVADTLRSATLGGN